MAGYNEQAVVRGVQATMRSPTLALVTPTFFPELIGTPHYATDIARWFSGRGWRVQVVTAQPFYPQYARYPEVSEVEITANVEAAGSLVARQVNRLADTGAKVIISTIPDVGFSPYALAQKAAHIDTDRQALIQRLVEKFNTALKLQLDNDGKRIGLVLLDEAVRQVVNFPGTHGIQNGTLPVCDLSKSQLTPPSILDCTEFTLIINGTGAAFLWADDRHLSYGGQQMLGNLAASRAKNNPF